MGGKQHKSEEDDYWGYLIEADRSPTPLFQQLLIGIAHYISKHVAPWEVKTLTPSKLATFYRLVGGNYDSLFLESTNASISFIYKSLGCYHSLQPTKDPFAAPTIPALTNDGFVRWQTVQLLLGPDEHVPFLQKAVKSFEIKNPMTGELFPQFLPAEALPNKPDPDMTRWHDFVGQKLFLECGPEASAADRPLADTEAYVQSPLGSAGRRPPSFGQTMASPPTDARAHRTQLRGQGLHAPPENVRRHSVPDRARGEAEPASQRVYTPPPGKHASRGAARYQPPLQETPGSAGMSGEESYFARPSARRHGSSSHGRSGSNGSPHVHMREQSNDRRASQSQSHSHSRSPPPPTLPPPQPQSQAQLPRRPPLASADSSSRRHTLYGPGPYNKEPVRASAGSPEVASQNRVYSTMSPPFYGAPPGSAGGGQPGTNSTRHTSISANSPPNILPGAFHAASPPPGSHPLTPSHSQHQHPPPPTNHAQAQAQAQAIPPHLRSHAIPLPPPPPPPGAPMAPSRSNHGSSSGLPGARPGSSSSEVTGASASANSHPILPGPGPTAPISSSVPNSATFLPGPSGPSAMSPSSNVQAAASGVRFADPGAPPRSSIDAVRSGSMSMSMSPPSGSPILNGAQGFAPTGNGTANTNGYSNGMGNVEWDRERDREREKARRRTIEEATRSGVAAVAALGEREREREREKQREREEMEFEVQRRRQRGRDRSSSGTAPHPMPGRSVSGARD